MKVVLAAAAALSLIASTAFAAGETWLVKFEAPDGAVVNVTFKDADKTIQSDVGGPGTYTYDTATHKLCGNYASGAANCVTMGGDLVKPGDTVSYTDDAGKAGKATMVSMN